MSGVLTAAAEVVQLDHAWLAPGVFGVCVGGGTLELDIMPCDQQGKRRGWWGGAIEISEMVFRVTACVEELYWSPR